jgi:HPt (histidine-containing phosphotransfer) domain-containing protein
MPETNRLSTVTWNRSAALSFLGGDESLLNQVLEMFLADSPKLLSQAEQALLHRDGPKLELAAHSLKGELQYLAQREAIEIAEKLEVAGRTSKMDGAEESLHELRCRLAALWNVLSQKGGS